LAKLVDAGLVSINGKPYSGSAPSQQATENEGDRKNHADSHLTSDVPSSSTDALVFGLDTSPSLQANEESLEFSTIPTARCRNIELPRASRAIATGSSSKRPSEVMLSTSSDLVNHTASKRQKTSSKLNKLKEFKVPETPVRFHQLSSANNLGICTSQHLSATQPLSSALPKISPDLIAENVPDSEKSQTSLSTASSLLTVPSATLSFLPTPLQRNGSSVTDITPLSHISSSFSLPRILKPQVGLSRNIISSSSNLQSRATSTLTDYTVNKSQSQSQRLKFNPPRPSSTLRLVNQGQTNATRPPVSPGYTSATPQTMETAILSNLNSIALPPLISQRKRLSLLSLALCYLNDAERITCVLVSKLFRYAGMFLSNIILYFISAEITCPSLSFGARHLRPKLFWETPFPPDLQLAIEESHSQNDEPLALPSSPSERSMSKENDVRQGLGCSIFPWSGGTGYSTDDREAVDEP
jgi:hypothetical protein